MREIRTSGLMSGEGKRVVQAIPRLSSTLLLNAWRLILGFRVVAWRSGDQGTDERGEKLLASFADIVNKLEEPKIDREFFL